MPGILARRCISVNHLARDRIPRNGPTAILISRLERLGWTFNSQGHVCDELGAFDLFRVPIDAIRQRLAWTWPSVMACEISHRACFDGFHQVDLAETRRILRRFGDIDRVYYLCGLDGTMYTNKGKQHWQDQQADHCPFCGQVDGFEQRLWHCEHFASCRLGLSDSVLTSIAALPSCSKNHGWALRPPSFVALARELCQLSEQPVIHHPVELPCVGPLHLFTDGACSTPTEPSLRLASWAITQGGSQAHPFDSLVVEAGVVSGLVQTAFRAELMAMHRALQIVEQVDCECCIWCDCLGVIVGISKLQAMQWNLKPSQSHYDLWCLIADSLHTVGARARILQVYSHVAPGVGSTEVETWAFWHNSLVDHAATVANDSRGAAFWAQWRQCRTDLQHFRTLHEAVATMLVKTGKLADQGTKTPAESANPPRFSEEVPNQIFSATIAIPQTTAVKFGFEATAWVHQWWLASGDVSLRQQGNLQWVSFLQLFIDYQLSTGCPGPILVDGNWKFRRQHSEGEFSYIKLCKWFQMLVKHYWKGNSIVIEVKSTRPASASIGCWLVCARVLWDQCRLQRVEEIISQQQGGFLQLGKHIEDMHLVEADPNLLVREPIRGLRSGM